MIFFILTLHFGFLLINEITILLDIVSRLQINNFLVDVRRHIDDQRSMIDWKLKCDPANRKCRIRDYFFVVQAQDLY